MSDERDTETTTTETTIKIEQPVDDDKVPDEPDNDDTEAEKPTE